MDELLEVLWAYRITVRTPTGETPFSLSYGYKVMVPIEIRMSSLKRENYDPDQNNLLQRPEIDFLKEKQCDSQLWVAIYQRRTARYLNSKVKTRRFKIGDLVLRKVLQNKGALDLNWEDLFKIAEVLAPGAYKLSYLSGEHISTSWNADHLKT